MILEVAVVVDGRKYVGSYSVKDGMISVTCPTYGGKTAQLDGTPARLVARDLLEEIIDGAIARGELESADFDKDEIGIDEL